MGKRRKASKYSSGGVTLGKSAGWWVADWNDGQARKRSRLIPLSRPEHEAKAALNNFAEARTAVTASRAALTVGDLWELWLADRKSDGLSNAIYVANWASLGPHFAHRNPELITTQDCRDYAAARFAAGRAPSTVHTELSRLRACLHWAVANRRLRRDAEPKIWVPQPGRPRDDVLSPDEAARLIVAARDGDPHVGLFVILLFATGGRHKAVLDLTWDRVDFERGTISLDEMLRPDPMSKSWRKGRATVAMSKLAREALAEAFPGRQTDHVIEHGGRRLKTAREGFANAVTRAGLSGVTPHTIRHTIATWLHGRVETAWTAQLLGHRDEATTRRVYTHPDAEGTRDAVQVIDSQLAALPAIRRNPARAAPKPKKKRRLLSKIDKAP